MLKFRIFIFFIFCIFRKWEILNAASTKREISKVCTTPECKNAASIILESIDSKAAPCDDFYKFACGNFLKTAEIPKQELYIDRYNALQEKIREQLKSNLEEPIKLDEPKFFKLSKNFYKACMDSAGIAKNGLHTALAQMKKLGGWPVLEGDLWKEENFDWIKTMYNVQQFGYHTFYFFDFNVMHADFQETKKNGLHIDQPLLSLEREYLIKGSNDPKVKIYYNYMIDLAVMYGANRARAEKELKDVLNFEIELAKITPSDEDTKEQDVYLKVKDLTQKYPGIPWKEYLNKMLNSVVVIDDDELINVRAPTFFEKFGPLMKKTPKRVIANYLFWKVLLDGLPYVTKEVMTRQMQFARMMYGYDPAETRARWKECVDITSNLLSTSNRAIYVRKNFNQKSRKNVQELADDIEEHFKNNLKEADWMDAKTRKIALDKIESMRKYIGSLDPMLDDKALNEYYKTAEVTSNDFLQAYLNMTLFWQDRAFSDLRKPVEKTNWASFDVDITMDTRALYTSFMNTLEIPAGILQDIFFNENRPQYLNYAGIGPFVIGNTIASAFDNEDGKNGKNNDWWTSETKNKFLQKSACIKQQYGNYTVKNGGYKLNDTETERRNIADNGGVKIAYQAYQDWVKLHGPEPTLPGLNYSPSQLFWIQAAVTQCAKYTPGYLKNINSNLDFINELSSPSEFRVTGVFANRPEFAKDFNCPVGSKMNPVKKCSVW